VIFVDADMIAINTTRIPDLLTMQLPDDELLAVPDCAGRFLPSHKGVDHLMREINTGLFVVKPSVSLFKDIMGHVATIKSNDGSDQGFLSKYFSGRVTLLPAKFNYVRASHCIQSINRKDGFYMLDTQHVNAAKSGTLETAEELASRDIHAGQVVFAHFHYKPKPWSCADADHCGIEWAAGDTGIKSIYNKWRFWQNGSKI
jgi:hypothetical protein